MAVIASVTRPIPGFAGIAGNSHRAQINMPLVAHKSLPTYEYLRKSGQEILTLGNALHQDIRELHIGFLNMMPDAALTVT